MWFGDALARGLYSAMGRLFNLSREEIFDVNKLFDIVSGAMVNILLPLLLILITLFIAALIGAAGVGGRQFLCGSGDAQAVENEPAQRP